MARIRDKCVSEKKCDINDIEMQRFDRLFMNVPEHTWGLATGIAPNNWTAWTNEALDYGLKNIKSF